MTLDPTMREMAQAAAFLNKHFGNVVQPEHVAELAFVFQQMRIKEREYVVAYLQREEDDEGNDVFDGALVEAGDAIAIGRHLP